MNPAPINGGTLMDQIRTMINYTIFSHLQTFGISENDMFGRIIIGAVSAFIIGTIFKLVESPTSIFSIFFWLWYHGVLIYRYFRPVDMTDPPDPRKKYGIILTYKLNYSENNRTINYEVLSVNNSIALYAVLDEIRDKFSIDQIKCGVLNCYVTDSYKHDFHTAKKVIEPQNNTLNKLVDGIYFEIFTSVKDATIAPTDEEKDDSSEKKKKKSSQ